MKIETSTNMRLDTYLVYCTLLIGKLKKKIINRIDESLMIVSEFIAYTAILMRNSVDRERAHFY